MMVSAVAALAQKFADALAACTAAERHHDDCERRYLEDGPMPPAALTRAGPLGKGLSDTQWWDVDDLAFLLTDRARRRHWPVARRLLRLARAYRAADKRFARACRLPAAEAACEAARAALDALAEAILALPPQAGALALKARAVKLWGKPEWWSATPSHADCYERMAAQVLDAVEAARTASAHAAAEPPRSPCAG